MRSITRGSLALALMPVLLLILNFSACANRPLPAADQHFAFKSEEEFARTFTANQQTYSEYINPVPNVYYRSSSLPDGSMLEEISMWLGFGLDGFSYDLKYSTHTLNVYYQWQSNPHDLLEDIQKSVGERKELIREFRTDSNIYYYIDANDVLPTTIFFSTDDIKFTIYIPGEAFREELIEKFCQVETAAAASEENGGA